MGFSPAHSAIVMHRMSPLYTRITKCVVRSSHATVPLAAMGAFYHRPVPDLTEGNWGGPSHYQHEVASDEDLAGRAEFFGTRGTVEAVVASQEGKNETNRSS
jgi:hypothetical protein